MESEDRRTRARASLVGDSTSRGVATHYLTCAFLVEISIKETHAPTSVHSDVTILDFG